MNANKVVNHCSGTIVDQQTVDATQKRLTIGGLNTGFYRYLHRLPLKDYVRHINQLRSHRETLQES